MHLTTTHIKNPPNLCVSSQSPPHTHSSLSFLPPWAVVLKVWSLGKQHQHYLGTQAPARTHYNRTCVF